MRVLVCGGRSYKDKAKVFKILDDHHNKKKTGIHIIICGAATGADTIA